MCFTLQALLAEISECSGDVCLPDANTAIVQAVHDTGNHAEPNNDYLSRFCHM
jgi:hypothetical protein